MPLLTGCALLCPKPLVQTRTIEVPGPAVHAPIPASLTAPTRAPDVPNRPLYCDDLERDAFGARAALERCNADKASIRALDEDSP